jgi:hypothetical protein
MAAEFRKGVSTILFGEALALSAVLAFSPKAREVARPYLVRGIRRALALGEEMKGMVEERRWRPPGSSGISRSNGSEQASTEVAQFSQTISIDAPPASVFVLVADRVRAGRLDPHL